MTTDNANKSINNDDVAVQKTLTVSFPVWVFPRKDLPDITHVKL